MKKLLILLLVFALAIGSRFTLTATGQGDTAGRSYTYAPDDQVLMGGDMGFKNLKMNNANRLQR